MSARSSSCMAQLVAERDKGRGVLLISFDLDEIFDLSDRILVIYQGKIVGDFPSGKVTRAECGLLMGGKIDRGSKGSRSVLGSLRCARHTRHRAHLGRSRWRSRLLVGAIFILLSQQNPIDAYRALLEGAFGSRRAIGETLAASTPYIFGGLAFAVAYRAGLFNIGIEGQMIMGGLAAGLFAAWNFDLPRVIYLPTRAAGRRDCRRALGSDRRSAQGDFRRA